MLDGNFESNCLEFKGNNQDPKIIGKLCSALSNSARIAGENFAYVLWGIRNSDHKIIGTNFDPDKEINLHQVEKFKLAQKLKPNIDCSFKIIDHPNGRVVMLEIPATTLAPVEFEGTAYVRIGSATPKLADHTNKFQTLIKNLHIYTWEKEVAKSFLTADEVLKLIDYPSYFKLTHQGLPDNKVVIFQHLESDELIVKDVGGKWNILNLGAILFATNLNKFPSSIARKGVRFVAYEGNNKATKVKSRIDGSKGYAVGFEGLVTYINNLLPYNEHIGQVLRKKELVFPEIAIRELIVNALIHQDMTISGAGPQVELFKDRMEITNPGKSLIDIDRMIDLPPRSRNEGIAALMRRMGFCEEQGSGLDKVIDIVELYQLPAPMPTPKFQMNEDSMQIVLYAPRPFAKMSQDERIRACFYHTVMKYLSGDKMKNSSLCKRFGINKKNAAQVSKVIKKALNEKKIKVADKESPRAGYYPWWA